MRRNGQGKVVNRKRRMTAGNLIPINAERSSNWEIGKKGRGVARDGKIDALKRKLGESWH